MAVMVAPRPPTGRVLGVTVMAPPFASAVLAILPRANTGKRREVIRSEFASGGAPGFAVSVGDTTSPGVASDPASQVEWLAVLTPAEPDGARCQASAWFAGTTDFQRFLEGW